MIIMTENKTDVIHTQTNKDISKELDLSQPESVINYGISAQNKLLQFSDEALKMMSENNYNNEIDNLTNELIKSIDTEKEKQDGILKRFFSPANLSEKDPSKYFLTASDKLDILITKFDQYQYKLIRDINILQTLYDKNAEYYNNLTEYINYGHKKVEEIEENDLAKLDINSMEYNTVKSELERFKSRLLDLELSKNVSLQLAPQIKLLQASNEKLVNKIQTTIVSTIPLWKAHMIIALSIENNLEVNKLLSNVDNSTLDLSKKNYDYIENIKNSGKNPVLAVNAEFIESIEEMKNKIN